MIRAHQFLFVVLVAALAGISQAAPSVPAISKDSTPVVAVVSDVVAVSVNEVEKEASDADSASAEEKASHVSSESDESDEEAVVVPPAKATVELDAVKVDKPTISPVVAVTSEAIADKVAAAVEPTAETAAAAVEKVPVVNEVELFVKEASSQLFSIFNELAHIIVDVNQHIDFSSSLIEKLNAAAEKLKALSFAAKEHLSSGDATISSELKFALQKIRRSGDVFILGEDAAILGINLNALKNMATDKDIAPYETDDSEEKAFDPQILEIIELTYDPEEVKYYWKAWHDKNSQYAADYLFEVVELFKKAAESLELPVLEFWYENYSKEFLGEMDEIMKQLKPFYNQLHAYVRQQLFQRYGAGVIKPNGPIPEHLYDQVIVRNWKNDFVSEGLFSYSNLPDLDKKVPYVPDYDTAEKLLKQAEKFYTSIGFEPLPEEYWKTKIVQQPENEESTVCTPTINDITYDVSLQYCDKVNFKTLMQDYAFIGRIHFALEKKNLPAYFFSGYNLKYPIGEAIILSASNHLQDLLVHVDDEDYEYDLKYDEDMFLERNFRMAINTMFKIPRFYVHAKIMTGLLEGTVEKTELNKYYWALMEEHAGVEPSVDREDDSLDLPFSFYTDLNQNNDVTSKFTSEVLGYQFYRALCQKAAYIGDLHLCDFHGNKEVGKALKEIVSLGSSKPWREVIGVLLPEKSTLEAKALLEYYAPIRNKIKKYNKENKLKTGWEHSTKKLSEKVYLTEEAALAFVQEAEKKLNELYNKISAEAFNQTADSDDIDEFWKRSEAAIAANAISEISLEAKKFYHNKFQDGNIKKALSKLSKIADVFVLADKIENLMNNKKSLKQIGSDVDITRYQSKDDEDDVAYIPDIQEIFKNSSDYKELLHYWEAWRDRNSYYAQMLLFDTLEDLSTAADKLDISPIQFWFKQYSTDFLDQMETVISDLRPLYTQLYSYIREVLARKYDEVTYTGLIPDHMYQQVMQQVWTNYSAFEEDLPFNKLAPNDKFIHEHNYNGLNLLEEADKFYQSLGFEPLEEDFWKNRVKQDTDADENAGNCHATIYDWSPIAYVRYCEKVDFKKFLQAHGYMGRVHYAHEKRNVPSYYFNSYFLEYPVGEAIILSASSPKHLQEIGLSGDFEFTDEVQRNRLIRMAVHTFFNLHLHFVRTKVVADYLNGDVTKEDITKHYWKLMIKYAGVDPPLDRKDSDFDFPFEFYADLDQNHQLKKFVSEVLGYQFYESLCKNHKGDLHNCDFYGDKKAGASLQEMFRLGGSKSWQSTVKVLLPDGPKLSAGAILRYYSPIKQWLDKQTDEKSIYVEIGNTDRKFYRAEDFIPEETNSEEE